MLCPQHIASEDRSAVHSNRHSEGIPHVTGARPTVRHRSTCQRTTRSASPVHVARGRSVRRGRVGAARRPDQQLERRHRSPSSSSASSSPSAGRSTPPTSSSQKYFRGTLGTARARAVAAPGHRPGRRHHHHVGHRGRLLRRRRRGRGVQRRAEVHPRHPARRVQQPGVVQHRRRRACRSRPAPASSCRSTTRWTRSSTGTAKKA